MKDLIYLDTSFLHSFIAQVQGGLPTSTNIERQEQINETSQKSHGFSSRSYSEVEGDSGSFSIPGLLKSPSGKIRLRIQPGKASSETISLSELESGKEIISLQLHDNALETFEKHLISTNKLFNIDDEEIVGNYIKNSSNFKVIDFNYLKKIIQPATMMEFMYMTQQEEINKLKEEIKNTENKQQKNLKQAMLNQALNKFTQEKNQMKNNFDFIEKSLNYLCDILPNESFLIMDNTISPLKSEFLREKANELMFKYGGDSSNLKCTLVGKVAQEIEDTSMPDLTDPFFEFPRILTAVLHPLGIINKGDLIISPIAIYFE